MADIDLEKLRVLLIDDETFTRRTIVQTLYGLGIKKVTEAADGLEGLTIFSNARNTFNLVICDLEMPKMDGLEFVRQLRKKEYLPNSNVPILILTGHSEPENVQSAVKAGINGYLIKPVSNKQLEKRIIAALTSEGIDPKRLN